jgi:hypothetical protein
MMQEKLMQTPTCCLKRTGLAGTHFIKPLLPSAAFFVNSPVLGALMRESWRASSRQHRSGVRQTME